MSEGSASVECLLGGFVEVGRDLYEADDVSVEFRQVLRGYPVLLMDGAADRLNFVATQELFAHAEARDVAAPVFVVPRVPVARDLRGVLLVEHGVEDRRG